MCDSVVRPRRPKLYQYHNSTSNECAYIYPIVSPRLCVAVHASKTRHAGWGAVWCKVTHRSIQCKRLRHAQVIAHARCDAGHASQFAALDSSHALFVQTRVQSRKIRKRDEPPSFKPRWRHLACPRGDCQWGPLLLAVRIEIGSEIWSTTAVYRLLPTNYAP